MVRCYGTMLSCYKLLWYYDYMFLLFGYVIIMVCYNVVPILEGGSGRRTIPMTGRS